MKKYEDLVILAGKENTKENILVVSNVDSENNTYKLLTLDGTNIEGTFTDSDLVDFNPNYDAETIEKISFDYKGFADNMRGFKVIADTLNDKQENMFNDMIERAVYSNDPQFGEYLTLNLSKEVRRFNETHNLALKSGFICYMKDDIDYCLVQNKYRDLESLVNAGLIRHMHDVFELNKNFVFKKTLLNILAKELRKLNDFQIVSYNNKCYENIHDTTEIILCVSPKEMLMAIDEFIDSITPKEKIGMLSTSNLLDSFTSFMYNHYVRR